MTASNTTPSGSSPKASGPRFVKAYPRILRHPDLSMTAKCVYLVVKSYANAKGEAFPARWRIAANCGIGSMRTLTRALNELKAFGVLFWNKGYSGRANTYQLTDLQCHYRLVKAEVQKVTYSQVLKVPTKKNQCKKELLQETPDNVVALPGKARA